jgi:hypothetical protein
LDGERKEQNGEAAVEILIVFKSSMILEMPGEKRSEF